jgi:hypothetical protein
MLRQPLDNPVALARRREGAGESKRYGEDEYNNPAERPRQNNGRMSNPIGRERATRMVTPVYLDWPRIPRAALRTVGPRKPGDGG